MIAGAARFLEPQPYPGTSHSPHRRASLGQPYL
jgi:hypothetical protein